LPAENALEITFEENREVIAGTFENQEYHPFIWLTNLENEENEEKHVVPGLFWHNSEDDAHPYASGLVNHKGYEVPWNYISENYVYN
jgi:hypothetical protein